MLGGTACTVAAARRTQIFSQGGREDGRSVSENFGFTHREAIFGATHSAVDRSAGMKADSDWTLSEIVIAACMEVHSQLGPGLLESIYEASLCAELELRQIPYERQKPISVVYKGKDLEQSYRIDLLVDRRFVIEIKAVDELLPVHAAQVITYLRITGFDDGLLVNFNAVSLRHGLRRLSRTHETSRPPVLPVKKSGSV
jgi:GxxExxY protein